MTSPTSTVLRGKPKKKDFADMRDDPHVAPCEQLEPKRRKRKLDPEKIKGLYEEGFNTKEIAKSENAAHSSVHQILKRLGVKMRSIREAHRLSLLKRTGKEPRADAHQRSIKRADRRKRAKRRAEQPPPTT
jgi:predicted DNA-binding protein YlxM (UPF0122 family)